MPKGKHDVLWDMVVNASFLGRLWGITMRRVQELGAQGVIPKKDRGRYVLGPACLAYSEYQRMNPSGGKGFDLTDQRTRLTRFQADNEEMESAKMKGSLVDKEFALEIWQGLLGAFKSKIGSATARMRPIINNIKTKQDKREANEFLSTLHREALDELSGIQAADYRSDQESTDSGEASSEHDDEPVGRRKKAVKPGVNRRVRKVPDKKG